MHIILISIAAIILSALFSFLANYKNNSKRFSIITKILSLLFLCCYLTRLFGEDVITGVCGPNEFFLTKGSYYFIVILRFLSAGILLPLICVAFFTKRKELRNIVSFIVPVISILNLLMFKTNMYAISGYVPVPSYSFREIEFGIEIALGFSIGCTYLVNKIINKDFKNIGKQLLWMFVSYLIFAIICMPYSTLENLFGLKGDDVENFNTPHLLQVLSTLVVIFGFAFFLRKKDNDFKYYAVAMYAFSAFQQFFQDYTFPFTVKTLPLHLCHLGIILMTITFATKNKDIFYFCFFANVFGALVALISPTVNEAVTSHQNIHFFYEHIAVFTIPIICMIIGLFKKPRLKQFLICLGVFALYYAIIFFVNSMFYETGVSYLFMNEDKLIDVFTDIFPQSTFGQFGSFFANIKDNVVYTTILGKEARIYPKFWTGIFIVYIILILCVWLAFYGLFKISDDHRMLHQILVEKRIDMLNLRKENKDIKKEEPLYPEDQGNVRISHFTKIYNGSDVKSVDDFSLTIHGGEVYGFLGHNGAGKSTTIKSLVGIQTITEGTISVNGYDIEKQSVLAKLNIGYVSDNHAVYEKLTGREYINYVANLYLVPEEEREERFNKYVKMFNLEHAIDREIKGYSHGMKQKIVVIASLMHDPKVWVLDEPLTGLDPTSSFQIKECMRDHANRGNIVFFSSHVIEVVEKICDKICIIGHGKLIGEWDLHKLSEEGITLEQLYMKYVAGQNLVTDVDGKTMESEK